MHLRRGGTFKEEKPTISSAAARARDAAGKQSTWNQRTRSNPRESLAEEPSRSAPAAIALLQLLHEDRPDLAYSATTLVGAMRGREAGIRKRTAFRQKGAKEEREKRKDMSKRVRSTTRATPRWIFIGARMARVWGFFMIPAEKAEFSLFYIIYLFYWTHE